MTVIHFHVTVAVNRQDKTFDSESETMRCEAVLLLLVASAVVLECCCASPAAFGDSEKELVRERRRSHTGRTEEEGEEEEEEEEPTTAASNTGEINVNLLQLLQGISEFISRTGNAATNCVTQACFPFDAGRCLTCLALVGLAAVGK